MEAVVVDAGSKLLKAGITLPDQAPGLVMPSKMKTEVEEGEQADDAAVVEEVVHGFVKDWDAMEDLLSYVLYRNIGWEMGDKGQILFTEPLFMPKEKASYFTKAAKLKAEYTKKIDAYTD